MRSTILVILLAVPAAVAAQTVQVEYVAEEWSNGTVLATESGSYYFGEGTQYRHDWTMNGERVSVIAHGDGTRTEVNHSLGVGQRGPSSAPFAVPTLETSVVSERPALPRESLPDVNLTEPWVSQPLPEGARVAVPAGGLPGGPLEIESLGVQARGAILLEGYRYVMAPVDGEESTIIEAWSYRHGGTFHLLETSHTTTMLDGRVFATTRRIVGAPRRVATDGTFDVPAGVRIQDVYRR